LNDFGQGGSFVVSDVVNGLVEVEKWWYLVRKCHKIVVPYFGAYYCKGCVKLVFQMVPMFVSRIFRNDRLTC